MKVVVIIPAAGLGTRMSPVSKGKGPSKQFTELGGTPILIHTMRKFAASPRVNEIVVALRKDEMAGFQERLRAESAVAGKTRLVEGGEHRQHSVANALATVTAGADDVVLVHDAVRPFVTSEIIEEVIRGAEKFGAAIAGVPAVDTVKKVERTADGALITATIPREHVVMAQTPQGFLGTDEASLVERSGREVAVVMGSPRNIKITTPGDMKLAEFYLRN
jgi:2-C-methyl-D-erythritol 4-phosphate cytidylyltransferase